MLTRWDFPNGTPGYLYFQACALVSGLDAYPIDVLAVLLSDFDFENSAIGSGEENVDASDQMHLSAQVPGKPLSTERIEERMGTAMIAGFTAAFACEVGMKTLLLTRIDKAPMTHNLQELNQSLPEDCQNRLQADFAGIADILTEYQQVALL